MKILLPALLLLFGVTAVPAAEVQACPPWEVTVVDEQGRPVPGCTVLQEWGCKFGKAATMANTNALTDAKGQAVFPARTVGPPPSEKGIRKLARLVDGLGQGEPWATVYVARRGHEELWIYAPKDPNIVVTAGGYRSKVTLKKAKPDDVAR